MWTVNRRSALLARLIVSSLLLAVLIGSSLYNYTNCPRPDFPSCLQYAFGGWMVGP
jgi:hypothetical protein